jgi:SAM-dependent methyltransferase
MDATAWDERYAASELVWSVGPNQFVAAECADLPPGRALDLAAGEGRNAIWLTRHGWAVTAVDFAQAGLDKGRQLAGDLEIDWVHGDAVTGSGLDKLDHRGTGLDDRGFDLVVIAYLQLPVDERRQALRRAFGLLTEGGTFLLVAHDSTNLGEGVDGPQDPSVLLSAQDVLDDLAGESFDVVRAERVDRIVEKPEGPRTARDALVRLIRRS